MLTSKKPPQKPLHEEAPTTNDALLFLAAHVDFFLAHTQPECILFSDLLSDQEKKEFTIALLALKQNRYNNLKKFLRKDPLFLNRILANSANLIEEWYLTEATYLQQLYLIKKLHAIVWDRGNEIHFKSAVKTNYYTLLQKRYYQLLNHPTFIDAYQNDILHSISEVNQENISQEALIRLIENTQIIDFLITHQDYFIACIKWEDQRKILQKVGSRLFTYEESTFELLTAYSCINWENSKLLKAIIILFENEKSSAPELIAAFKLKEIHRKNKLLAFVTQYPQIISAVFENNNFTDPTMDQFYLSRQFLLSRLKTCVARLKQTEWIMSSLKAKQSERHKKLKKAYKTALGPVVQQLKDKGVVRFLKNYVDYFLAPLVDQHAFVDWLGNEQGEKKLAEKLTKAIFSEYHSHGKNNKTLSIYKEALCNLKQGKNELILYLLAHNMPLREAITQYLQSGINFNLWYKKCASEEQLIYCIESFEASKEEGSKEIIDAQCKELKNYLEATQIKKFTQIKEFKLIKFLQKHVDFFITLSKPSIKFDANNILFKPLYENINSAIQDPPAYESALQALKSGHREQMSALLASNVSLINVLSHAKESSLIYQGDLLNIARPIKNNIRKRYKGSAKADYIENAYRELSQAENFDQHSFHFKVFLACCFQHQNKKQFFFNRTTGTGREIVGILNNEKHTHLRVQLFGNPSKITYDSLARNLYHDKRVRIKAEALVHDKLSLRYFCQTEPEVQKPKGASHSLFEKPFESGIEALYSSTPFFKIGNP